MGWIINKFIENIGQEDYFFIVQKSSEYNTTGKTELHSLDSFEPILTGNLNIIIAVIKDKIEKRWYY